MGLPNQSRSRKGTGRNGEVGMENKKECPYRKELDFSLWFKRTCRYCTLEQRKTCNVKKEAIKITNADRIRSMTDEELAEWLNGFSECLIPNDDCLDKYCNNCVLKWIKSEVECE